MLATTIVDDRGRTNVFGGDDVLRTLQTRAAHAGYATDPGRVVRRMAHDLEKLDTLAVAIVERAQDRRDPGGASSPTERPWIDYHGKANIKTIPFYRVVRGDFPKGTFENKIVIVGATAPIASGRPSDVGERRGLHVRRRGPRQLGLDAAPRLPAARGAGVDDRRADPAVRRRRPADRDPLRPGCGPR